MNDKTAQMFSQSRFRSNSFNFIKIKIFLKNLNSLRLRNINNSNNNVRNLNDLRDDDDENATWNGNSTQQM